MPLQIFQSVVVCTVLSACASVPVPSTETPLSPLTTKVKSATDLPQIYADLGKAGGRVFTLNPKTSTVRMYAFRAGKAAKFGHNHVLSAPDFQGFFNLSPDGPAASRFDLAFRLNQLAFDAPEHRAVLGPAFASVISPEDRASTRNNMLGDNNFQAARFPILRIQSLQIAGDSPKFAAKIAVELHGQTHEMWTPLTVTGLPERLNVQGTLVLKQSDFGIKTFSVFGGILAVQDEVVVEFTLVGDAQ
jgi:polyisoprenoid-binding protein YceI